MSYGLAGSGGREPVSWLGAPPARRDDGAMTCRRPVVAVLDTGVGDHPWFKIGVERNAEFNGSRIGMAENLFDAEALGRRDDPLGGTLDPDTGHGTFIAGLIRQLCPDANILSVRVMHSDGVVPEDVLLEALTLLALRQKTAQRNNDPDSIIDIVSLSLGYYHEHPDEKRLDSPLRHVIRELGELGVIVVAAAGNDATNRPMYPAAFAPRRDDPSVDAGCPPLIAVGALNPNGSTALFSNAGPWVTTRCPGASLISTFPTAVDGPAQPDYRLEDGELREGPDQDDFAAGFAVWSGTSFAAPVFAGKLAASMVAGTCGDLDTLDATTSVQRAWSAIEQHTWLTRPQPAQTAGASS
jgi:subtilisin family serine protease